MAGQNLEINVAVLDEQLRHIQNALSRIEDKLEQRLTDVENRVGEVEDTVIVHEERMKTAGKVGTWAGGVLGAFIMWGLNKLSGQW
jgi:hypothetical protein